MNADDAALRHTLDALERHVALQGHTLTAVIRDVAPYEVELCLYSHLENDTAVELHLRVFGSDRNEIILRAQQGLSKLRSSVLASLIGPMVDRIGPVLPSGHG